MWRNYLSTALGSLRRNRLYAGLSILSLAVGFTVAILASLLARHELSYERFLPDHDRTYLVSEVLTPPAKGAPWRAYPIRTDVAGLMRLDFPQVEAITRLAPDGVTLGRDGVETAEPGFAWADPNVFDLLKLPVLAGDPRAALRTPDAIVLTRGLARKYFGRDAPLGETLTLRRYGPSGDTAGQPLVLRVTAVLRDLPPETHLKVQAFASSLAPDSYLSRSDRKGADAFGQAAFTYLRLRPGGSPDTLREALPAFVARRIPSGPLMGSRFQLQLTPITSLHLPSRPVDNPGLTSPSGDLATLGAVALAAALVLLTAAVNFVGLTTARASRRAVEVGVRKAAGAARRDLVWQFLVEALIQAGLALVLALAASELLAPVMGALVQRPLRLDYMGDLPMLGEVLGAAVLTGLAAGLYPALVLAGFKPVTALKGGLGEASGSSILRQALVTVQFAILVLLILVIATISRQSALALDPGRRFGGEQVVWVDEQAACEGAFQDRIRALPGVKGAVCASRTALANGSAPTSALTREGLNVSLEMGPVDFGFFEFYGLKPVAGRLFAVEHGADDALRNAGDGAQPPVILNQTAVRRLGFASPQAAVGQSVRWSRLSWNSPRPARLLPNQPSEIIGVVPDYAMGVSREPIRPMIYWVDPAFFNTSNIRLDGPATPQTLKALDRMWKGVGHHRPMQRQFLDQAVQQTYRDVLVLGVVVAICTALALFLACIGLFALAAFTTEQRTKEIGIRKALGAETGDVVRLLLWQFTRPVLAANLIAWPIAAWTMDRWLQGFADRVDLPPWLFLAAGASAVVLAWATVGVHTWLIARARPVAALRYE